MKTQFGSLDDLSRRCLLTHAARSLLGVSLLPLGRGLSAEGASRQAGGRAKNVISLFMEGGISHLDTFDVKPQGDGPTQVTATSVPGIELADRFSRLPELMGDVALVRSMNTQTGAHQPGRYLMRTSYEEIATIRHPSLGPWAQALLGKRNKTLPDSVVIGGGAQHPAAGFMETRFSPLPIANAAEGLQNSSSPEYLEDKDFNKRLNLINSFDKRFREKYQHKDVRAYTDFYKETVALLRSDELAAFDIKQEKPEVQAAYGNHRFGQGALLARRLITNGVRHVEVVFGGWDDHNNIYDSDRLPARVNQLDQALAALLADLKQSGLLGETLVVLTTEFGRTPRISDRAGRDHHPAAFSALLAGGGIQGGQVFGKTDEKGAYVEEDGVTPADFNATVAQAMGLPLEQELISPSGRPFKVAHDGDPITALF
jgi:hypothetical protein